MTAQTSTGKLEGYVRDKDTGAPLAGAQVSVEGTRLGNITNEDGYYFILNVPVGSRNATAQFTGYQKTTISHKLILAGQTARVDFTLSSTVISLEGITVESEATPLIIRDNTVTKQRQTADQIEALPVSSIDDVINMQAGVVRNDNQISIRGGRVGEEAVYVDGILMKSFGAEATLPPLVGKTSFDDLSDWVEEVKPDNSPLDINTNAVEEITIITGGFNAEYGSAKSGVINIVTKEGTDQYMGNVRFRTDAVMPRRMDFGFSELSSNVGGPIPMLPFAYFNLSAELQGRMDWDPKSTSSERGFRSVDQTLVDRINTAFEGTDYMRATLDMLPEWGNPHPARRPGSEGNRYSLSEKITYSPLKELKILQTVNFSRTQRMHYQHGYIYGASPYSSDSERGKVGSILVGADYTIRQTSSQNMTLQVRANWFQDQSAVGQLYNPTAYNLFVEHHDPDYMMEIYEMHLGDLWNQPVNADLSPVTYREAIENFMYNDPAYANAEKRTMQGGVPLNYGLLPSPQDELLGFSWKDWVFTTEYWNKFYPLPADEWRVEVPAIINMRPIYSGDPWFTENITPWPLPGGPSWYYQGPLGLKRGNSFRGPGYDINYGTREDKKWNFKIDFDSQLDRFNRIKVGADIQYFDLHSFTNGQADYDNTIIDNNPYLFSGYVQDRFDLGDFVVDLGLRMEMLDPQGEQISFMGFQGEEGARRILMARMVEKQYEFAPRLGVAFPVTDRTQVRFSFGKFYQPPSFRQIFRGDNIGREDAKLEYSETTMLEAGFTALFTDDLVFEFVGYNKDIVGDFTYRRIFRGSSKNLYPAITNMDNGNVKGFDLNIQHKWSRYLNTRLTYSLQFARATGSDPIPVLNASTLTLVDPITLDVEFLPVLVSPTELDRTHTFNSQVYLMLPRDLRPGTLEGRIFRNVNASFMFTVNSGSPFNLGSQWDLINRGRSGTFINGDLRLSKGISVGGRRTVRAFVDVYNIFHNWVYSNKMIGPGTIRTQFTVAQEMFAGVPGGRYKVDPASGSYYWNNLHDLNKDGWVEVDEMRILQLMDEIAANGNPSGTARQVRAGLEFSF
ncbi:MAG: carboxypeptidase regulatory-like domain-containing protein [Candidatus Glassbacteria bacterium]|nr:carboxypeptidase regulatory-like domain-containing protein [Candidatus Glassbacteria bacterium]